MRPSNRPAQRTDSQTVAAADARFTEWMRLKAEEEGGK